MPEITILNKGQPQDQIDRAVACLSLAGFTVTVVEATTTEKLPVKTLGQILKEAKQ